MLTLRWPALSTDTIYIYIYIYIGDATRLQPRAIRCSVSALLLRQLAAFQRLESNVGIKHYNLAIENRVPTGQRRGLQPFSVTQQHAHERRARDRPGKEHQGVVYTYE